MPLSGANILVVDDNLDLAENLIEILSGDGASVLHAATGAEARERARPELHVALVDIGLPDATGLSLIPALRGVGDGHVAVVLITGNASIEDAIKAVQAGAYDYVVKPFDSEALRATVARAYAQVELRREVDLLERRTRLAEKLAAVGSLAAGLAHEIRNPLNAASLQLQLLERRIKRGADEASLLEPARLVEAEIQRLARLVDDFLAFARPSDRRSRPVDLVALARQVVELEQPGAQERQIGLAETTVGDRLTIHGDAEKLHQVLLNLVRNAIEAVGPGGHVTVEVEPASEGAIVRVWDDGPGIPAESRSRIFEPFFSTKPGGTGLGMAICHSLVSLHGGDIEVRPGSPTGTVVEVRLPADPPPLGEPNPPLRRPP